MEFIATKRVLEENERHNYNNIKHTTQGIILETCQCAEVYQNVTPNTIKRFVVELFHSGYKGSHGVDVVISIPV